MYPTRITVYTGMRDTAYHCDRSHVDDDRSHVDDDRSHVVDVRSHVDDDRRHEDDDRSHVSSPSYWTALIGYLSGNCGFSFKSYTYTLYQSVFRMAAFQRQSSLCWNSYSTSLCDRW